MQIPCSALSVGALAKDFVEEGSGGGGNIEGTESASHRQGGQAIAGICESDRVDRDPRPPGPGRSGRGNRNHTKGLLRAHPGSQ